MRKPDQITIDRVLLLHLLQSAEPFGLLNDVKLQQLAFLCELQMFAKGLKGFHFEFFRYAYGAFSKDLDNDLMSMRRKERVENFSVSREAEDVIELFLQEAEKTESEAKYPGARHSQRRHCQLCAAGHRQTLQVRRGRRNQFTRRT